jgi:valyl-tRNA synthetase
MVKITWWWQPRVLKPYWAIPRLLFTLKMNAMHTCWQNIILPITGRLVPMVADEYVEKDFGTGCVKITPAHDFNDYEVGKRCNLPIINIFNKNAEVLAEFEYIAKAGEQISQTIAAPADYIGLERFAARKKLVEQAEAEGWLDQIQPYDLKAPRGDRSGVIVEPLLTDQWYVKIAPLAEPAIEAVKDGRIKFVPEQYSNMYMAWMNNIQDWCISRQFGGVTVFQLGTMLKAMSMSVVTKKKFVQKQHRC